MPEKEKVSDVTKFCPICKQPCHHEGRICSCVSADNQHTPGPWEKCEKSKLPAIRAVTGGVYIAHLYRIGDSQQTEANANLIASAPELGQELLDIHLERICLNVECKDCKRIEALLKKAGLL